MKLIQIRDLLPSLIDENNCIDLALRNGLGDEILLRTGLEYGKEWSRVLLDPETELPAEDDEFDWVGENFDLKNCTPEQLSDDSWKIYIYTLE